MDSPLFSFTQTYFAKSILELIAQLRGQQAIQQQQQQGFAPLAASEIPTPKPAPAAAPASHATVVPVKEEEGQKKKEKKDLLNQRVSMLASSCAAAVAFKAGDYVARPYGQQQAEQAFAHQEVQAYLAAQTALLLARLEVGAVPSLCTVPGCTESLSGTNSTGVLDHYRKTHKGLAGLALFVSGWERLQQLKHHQGLYSKGRKSFPSYRGFTASFLEGLKSNFADVALATLLATDEDKQLACFASNFVAAMHALFPQACEKVFGKASGPKEPKTNKKAKAKEGS